MECAICLQKCVHPVRLPCHHIFCFLCVKGAAHQSKKCAMCRREIPENYFDNPNLIEVVNDNAIPVFDDGFRWYYEGKNGWWLYDQRTSNDIEAAFKNQQDKCELLIAGFLYVVDFIRMVQYRRSEPNRARKIRRDRLEQVTIKGVAGLKRTDVSETKSDPQNTSQSSDSPTTDSGAANDSRPTTESRPTDSVPTDSALTIDLASDEAEVEAMTSQIEDRNSGDRHPSDPIDDLAEFLSSQTYL